MTPARIALPQRDVVFDPEAHRWLSTALVPYSIGMPVWTIQASFAIRAEAERHAGLHDSPVQNWLLLDPALGWRRSSGHGWMAEPSVACLLKRDAAQRLLAISPALQLMVHRVNGRITCPDLSPAETADAA